MNLWESVAIAADALWANKLRTALTMLGIIIGVAAVIAVVAVAKGGESLIVQEVEAFGSGMIWVERNWEHQNRTGRIRYLTPTDVAAIARVPGVAGVSPEVGHRLDIRAGREQHRLVVSGVAPGYAQVRNIRVASGRFLSDADWLGSRRVAVIGNGLKERLFGEGAALGETIRLAAMPFTVVGVLEPTAGLLVGQVDRSAGDEIYVPFPTLARMVGTERVTVIFVGPDHPDAVPAIMEAVTAILARHHGPDLFRVRSLDRVLGTIRNVTTIMTRVVAGIAAVALLVGGIGIMNIMLVSVTERTREIGLRKAIGGRRRDLLWQFLIEAVAVALMGGVVGIVLGTVLVTGIARLANLPSLISPGSVALAVTFAAAVGVLFGVYPASKAARMDPIEALRYE